MVSFSLGENGTQANNPALLGNDTTIDDGSVFFYL
jgi:hypothetical protein